jgi:hypothetical protein
VIFILIHIFEGPFGYNIKYQEVLGRTDDLLSFDTTWTAQKTTTPEFSVAAGTSLTSSFLATIEGHTDRPTYSALILHRK